MGYSIQHTVKKLKKNYFKKGEISWKSVEKVWKTCGDRGWENLLKNLVEKFVEKLAKQIMWRNCVEHLVDKLGRQIWLTN